MKTWKYIVMTAALGLTVTSCYDLDLEPKGILGENTLLKSDNGIKRYLATVYQDLPIEDFNYKQNGGDNKGYATVNQEGWHTGNKWEAQKGSPAAAAGEATGREGAYGDGWDYWPYDRIRDINNFLEKLPEYSSNYKPEQLNAYLAEARFLRAFYYFGMVKRYGGVPVVSKVQDPKAPAEELCVPRSSEYDCYKFIYDDLKYAMENGAKEVEPGRAGRYAAAALMSRTMLYAACAAKYGATVGTTGPAVNAGLMSISGDKAQEFFQYAYDACKFIQEGGYKLHDGSDKEAAYAEEFVKETEEDIFVKQYTTMVDAIWDTSLFHCWDAMVLPKAEGMSTQVGAAIHPLWELVSLYEMPAVTDENGKPVRFDKIEDLWNDKVAKMEPRCRACFFFPGMTEPVSGTVLDIQAGFYTEYPGTAADGTAETDQSQNDYTAKYRHRAKSFGETEEINGQKIKKSGAHGIRTDGDEGYSTTGVLIRKYVNTAAAATTRRFFGSTQSFKVFRYGEILCNWAEAAYELGLLTDNEELKKEAFVHINELRDRAGATRHEMVANPADIGSELYGFELDENLQYIRDERARELCFENQRIFDIRRWRVAHVMHQNYWPHVLYPYYVLKDNKYIFLNEVECYGRKLTFDKKWYYNQIPGGQIGKNPALVRNDGY